VVGRICGIPSVYSKADLISTICFENWDVRMANGLQNILLNFVFENDFDDSVDANAFCVRFQYIFEVCVRLRTRTHKL